MKTYQKPTIQIVPIRHASTICGTSNPLTSVNTSNETGITYGGGNNGAARVREQSNVWDEEW